MDNQRFKNEKTVFARTHISIETHHVNVPGPIHLHDFYELEIVLSGCGQQNLNGSIYPLRPGTAFLLTPVDFHSITPKEPMKIQNLSFDSCMLPSKIQTLLVSEHNNLIIQNDDQLNTQLQFFIDVLSKECMKEDLFSHQIRYNLLELILVCLIRGTTNNTLLSPSKNQIDASLRYLFGHFTEDITLTKVASYSGYTPTYFSKVFRETCGTSFFEFLTTLRINYAKMLLLSTSLSTTEIAEKCGFRSAAGFFRRFQLVCDCTPNNFRKEHHRSSNQHTSDT